jgi:hypothetical protein
VEVAVLARAPEVVEVGVATAVVVTGTVEDADGCARTWRSMLIPLPPSPCTLIRS